MALEIELERNFPGFQYHVAFAAGSRPVGILGASGAGKTMTLRAIAGLESGMRGRIVLNGRTLFDSAKGIQVPSRERHIGLVFQHYALFPHMTVEQNIAFGLRDLPPEERQRRIAEQVAAMHLTGLEQRRPAALSGGQQQRVALARALAPQPAALLLDEPFSALDTHLRAQLERQLRETLAGYRGTTLLVSHNLEEIYRLCAELVVLDQGRVIARGSRDEIFRHPPDRATAQLTGCKNFSATRAVDEHNIEALDWGCALRVAQEIPAAVAQVAIRAHHLRVEPAQCSTGTPMENAFPCWLAAASEAPFRVTLYLRLHAPPASPADYHLQVEISQDDWAKLRTQHCPWRVQLDASRLFLLSS